ncbi:1-deoxy-D-xylulose-5-phosphate synthase N-terminal domain-containing protein [Amycolatopsis oliviviridis]|uniref:1-deoxy-D-xylulose-5-phosphate synthase n=1 Tax=Amycolatopsis oliviviridis TaxID=1471590 RepID=A0ABQ3MHD6_9PSEU|nr:1-deoxy-D-xylulose-5-phosphate synthase [Amycolatopsis oliviviridis]GHH37788.1 1-deoxy-D-xylulose-5-phosphate synthase [Amycolatopsis oliviviridis]
MTATASGTPRLLNSVVRRQGLARMGKGQLDALAREIREVLLETVCATGGHLGSNLGVVELTIALHRVFDPGRDRIVFDVGHQCYPHKLLTGRLSRFGRLRKAGGLSGYPARGESETDVVENSHASTALSYADGLTTAFTLRGQADRRVVVVIGDGALTGGMSWEAINTIGAAARPMVVVLNDNGRSYAPTVGSISTHLRDLRGHAAGANVFTNLGFAYFGPVDGHDVAEIEHAFRQASTMDRPALVHVVTVKGKGYPPAEADDVDHMHTVGALNRRTGLPAAGQGRTWTSVFAHEIRTLGAERPDLVCLSAAMITPTGLADFARAFPGRAFDVGIAEQHAVTRAAGLAMGGLHPVVAIYSTFLNRAVDQLLMDVALHRLPVTFVLDRAGVTGPDGPSHHGVWDLSVLGLVPGLRVAAPRDPATLRALLRDAVSVTDGPTAVRFPKTTASQDIQARQRIGPIDVLRSGSADDVLVVAVGPLAAPCLEAAERLDGRGVGVTVVDPRWVLPVPAELTKLALRHPLVVTVEDNLVTGGVGTHLRQALDVYPAPPPVRSLGMPPLFLAHGTRADLLREHGLDADGITGAVLRALASEEVAR